MTRMIITLALLLGAAAAPADVLLIEPVRQAERMELPDNGMNKSTVEARFGAPSNRQGAVGDPPISRWDYADFSVYFEYDLVLFSVLHAGAVIES
ncbi:MAG: hypothetical protein R3233_00615 [Xanthomonadales bacterium]|nr:hypothetical protein [Xanthomonadales bacterium]